MLAGYVLQTNDLSIGVVVIAAAAGLLSLTEIKASRPYKALKKTEPGSSGADWNQLQITDTLEAVLKSLSLGVIVLGLGLLVWRLIG